VEMDPKLLTVHGTHYAHNQHLYNVTGWEINIGHFVPLQLVGMHRIDTLTTSMISWTTGKILQMLQQWSCGWFFKMQLR